MKNSKQIADSVFKRRDEYVKRQKIRNEKIKKAGFICSAVCMLCVMTVGVRYWDDLLEMMPEMNGSEFISDTETTTTVSELPEELQLDTEVGIYSEDENIITEQDTTEPTDKYEQQGPNLFIPKQSETVVTKPNTDSTNNNITKVTAPSQGPIKPSVLTGKPKVTTVRLTMGSPALKPTTVTTAKHSVTVKATTRKPVTQPGVSKTSLSIIKETEIKTEIQYVTMAPVITKTPENCVTTSNLLWGEDGENMMSTMPSGDTGGNESYDPEPESPGDISVTDIYDEFVAGGHTYKFTGATCANWIIDNFLYRIQIYGYVEQTDYSVSTVIEVYSIQGISDESLIAVKFMDSDLYYKYGLIE